MSAVILIPSPPLSAATIAVGQVSQVSSVLLTNVFNLYNQLYSYVWNNQQKLAPQGVMDAIEQNNPGQSNAAAVISLLNDLQTLLVNNYPNFVLSVNPNTITVNPNGTVTITTKIVTPPITPPVS